MVHNGIEYGDMQLIAEAYALLKGGLAFPMKSWLQPLPNGMKVSLAAT
jgi:6-phosphogluconate dehydrogenase